MFEPPARRPGSVCSGLLGAGLTLLLSVPTNGQQPRPPETVSVVEAVRMALRSSPQLAGARYQVDEAEERVSEAWGGVYPDVDLRANYTRNVSPAINFIPARFFDPNAGPDDLVGVQFGADNQWQSTLTVEQPLFRAAAFIGVGAAGRYLSLQEETFRGVRHDVVTRVRTAYFQALLDAEQVRLTENSVRRVRETLSETRKLHEAGLSSEYDVLRLEVELANLEPSLQRSANALRQSRRTLAVELALDDSEALALTGSLATMNLDDPAANSPANQEILSFFGAPLPRGSDDARALVDLGAANRSDLLQLGLTESLRGTELKLEQAEYLPQISLLGTYAVSASQNGSPEFFGRPRAYSRTVGVQVTVPVFQGFARDARVDQKRAVLRAARVQTDYARRQAESEILTLTDRVIETLASARAQKLAVSQAQRGFEIARAQYREGLGSQLELTDAEVALRQSEFNYAQSVHDFLVARAELDEATGRVPLVDVDAGSGAGDVN